MGARCSRKQTAILYGGRIEGCFSKPCASMARLQELPWAIRTGLSPASITSISGQLIDEGLVYSIVEDEAVSTQDQTRAAANTIGAQSARPPMCWPFQFRSTALSLSLRISAGPRMSRSSCGWISTTIPKEEFGPRVAHEIKSNAKKLGIALSSITRIGIAVQGVADTITGEIPVEPGLPGPRHSGCEAA